MNAVRITRCVDCKMFIAEGYMGEGYCLEMSHGPKHVLDSEVIPDWCELLQYLKCSCEEGR